jgi:ankyrin repeat protein
MSTLQVEYNRPLKKYKRKIDSLHTAIDRGSFETVIFLVNNGADIHKLDEDGLTPLYLAVSKGRLDIAKLLIEKGADVNKPTSKGDTPIFIAASYGYLELIKLLIQHGATDIMYVSAFYVLHEAVYKNRSDLIELLIKYGADFDIENEENLTPLYLAIRVNSIESTKVLVENGALMFDEEDEESCGPLYHALDLHRYEIADLLIDQGSFMTKRLMKQINNIGFYDLVNRLRMMNSRWQPKSHKYFPKPLRQQIKTVIILKKRGGQLGRLPMEVLFYLIDFFCIIRLILE